MAADGITDDPLDEMRLTAPLPGRWDRAPAEEVEEMGRTRGFRRVLFVSVAFAVLLPGSAGAAPAPGRWQTCGRFVEVEAITTPGAYWTRLWDVAHLSTHDAWAVGYQYGNDLQGPVAFRWDGWRWSEVRLPSVGPAMADAVLDGGLAALGTDDVWAVGVAGRHPLALHWDGARWSRTPQPTGLRGELDAIAPIPGTRQLLAVGSRWTSDRSQPLIERWNGREWRRVATPTLPFGGRLHDVVAFEGVAYAIGARGQARPLAMRWDGATWRTIRVPQANEDGELLGVDGTGPGRVWIAGHRAGHGVLLRWEAGALRTLRRLDRPSTLDDVVAAGPRSIWAVGGVFDGGIDVEPIVLRGGAGDWVLDPPPTVADGSNGLLAVDGTPHDLWAVAHDAGEGPASYLLHRC
jgi:hypothetical protein